MKKILLLLTCALCIVHCVFAQSAMGSWTTHISYTNVNEITQSKEKIYGISAGALFSIDKENAMIETYSKVYGLNDNNIQFIKYSDENNILFIAYKNSNIDLLYEDGSVTNIPDLYRKNMSGSKKVNDICFFENTAYLACDFGITSLNLSKKEFKETYITESNNNDEKILNLTIFSNVIYAMSENNITHCSINKNMLNYQNWEKIPNPDINKTNKKFLFKDSILYLLKNDNTLYQYKNKLWSKYKTSINGLYAKNNILFLIDTNGVLTKIENNSEDIVAENVTNVLYDEQNNTIWYISEGIVFCKNLTTNEYNTFIPNGPLSNTSWKLKYSNGRIFSVPGGRWATNYFTPASLSFYENGFWQTYNTEYFSSHTTTIGTCYDLVDIAIDPNDKTHFWVASYGLGMYEFRNDEIYKFHHCENSGLVSIYQDRDPDTKHKYTRTDGLTYDNMGNLWLLNNAGNLVKYIDSEGTYHRQQYTVSALTPQDIIISNQNQNQKFLLIPRHTSSYTSLLFSFDDNGTLNNLNDDKTISLTKVYDQDNKELNFSQATPLLRSIAQDKNGTIWVGTTEGLFLINDPSKVFNNNFRVYRIKIPRNDGTGLADYLLGTEEIKAIAVDGANRKWIGTASSGIYLVSEDGLETIHHFTAENSPLLSNAIQSIAINDKTGEVFIGTGNGLISYQSDAIESSEKFENIRAYPNPVRPEYTGLITIIGLTFDTKIRITDVNGNLVYETISNGGAATWDGCNKNGERVATGVYFAHCISADGKQKHITKILIIK